jgi:hypothetical protein
LFAAHLTRHSLKVALHAVGAVQVTGQIAADFDVHERRWLEAVMGIKAGYLMKAMQRHVEPLRQRAQFLLRQVATTFLNMVEFLDDHGSRKHLMGS